MYINIFVICMCICNYISYITVCIQFGTYHRVFHVILLILGEPYAHAMGRAFYASDSV